MTELQAVGITATVGSADVQGDTDEFSRENCFNLPSTFSLPDADRCWFGPWFVESSYDSLMGSIISFMNA
jgi:hypothetical protein